MYQKMLKMKQSRMLNDGHPQFHHFVRCDMFNASQISTSDFINKMSSPLTPKETPKSGPNGPNNKNIKIPLSIFFKIGYKILYLYFYF